MHPQTVVVDDDKVGTSHFLLVHSTAAAVAEAEVLEWLRDAQFLR